MNMVSHRICALLAAVIHLAPLQATPTHPRPSPPGHSADYVYPANGICTDYTITREITAPVPVLGRQPFESNFDVAELLINRTAFTANGTPLTPFTGFKNATRSYTISATFCTPKEPKDGKEATVLVATHGLMYDRRYWASSYKPEEYNFVQYALENGYSVFYYDRVGTGKSEIVSGYENSMPNQVALLLQLVASIRSGKYTAAVAAKKVVLVGHSYGTFLSQQVLKAAPSFIDAALLTGLAFTSNPIISPILPHFVLTIFGARLANTASPPFARDNSYFGFTDIYSHLHGFFYPPFDRSVAEYAHSIYQPGAFAEIAGPSPPADAADPLAGIRVPDFRGPVLIASGKHDIACSGDCDAVYGDKYALQGQIFPVATPLETYVHPGAGHGVNFARNVTGFYARLIGFLDDNLHA